MVDPRTILSELGINYTETSSGLKARCPSPSHDDNKPSWNISTEPPFPHHCFSCGYSGSLRTLVKDLGGGNFSGLEKELYQYEFFNVPQKKWNEEETHKPITIRGPLLSVYSDSRCVDYLKRRFINRDFVDHYSLTYADNVRINNTPYQRRLCIPIIENGKLISVEGRSVVPVDDKKVIYPKSARTNTLFDYDNLDRESPLYVTEGIGDLPQLFNVGLRNLTTTFGITITRRQAQLLNEFKDVVVVPDNDQGGDTFINTIDESYKRGEFRILFPPLHRKDMGDATYKEVVDALRNRVATATEYLLAKNELHYEEKAPIDAEWIQ